MAFISTTEQDGNNADPELDIDCQLIKAKRLDNDVYGHLNNSIYYHLYQFLSCVVLIRSDPSLVLTPSSTPI